MILGRKFGRDVLGRGGRGGGVHGGGIRGIAVLEEPCLAESEGSPVCDRGLMLIVGPPNGNDVKSIASWR